MKRALLLSAFLLLGSSTILQAFEGTSKGDDNAKSVHDPPCPFTVWLGPQVNTGPFITRDGELDYKALVEEKQIPNYSRQRVEEHLEYTQIELRVVRGSKVVLPDTENGYVTLVNGGVSAIYTKTDTPKRQYGSSDVPHDGPRTWTRTKLPIEAKSLYVVGIVRLTKPKYTYYSLNVRIEEGPLAGALVHLRDDEHPVSLTDPYVAIYKIPEHLEVTEGDLAYKVVRMGGK